MHIEGIIKVITDTQFFSNDFSKRTVVVTTNEQYPQHISIDVVKDMCAVMDGYAEGQGIKIDVNLRGREWTNPQGEVKHFNSIQGWRITPLDTTTQPTQQAPVPTQSTPVQNTTAGVEEDLPF
tara:strand:+ start:398 stop:766 length:369 start_codon:yes stop_codon:yes gene_type:complete